MLEKCPKSIDATKAMIEKIVPAAMGQTSHHRIGLRSGAVFDVAMVSVSKLESSYPTDYEVTAIIPGPAGSQLYDQVQFLISDVEHVTLRSLEGVSPQRAESLHPAMTQNVINMVMTPEYKPVMDRFHDKAVQALSEQPEWFVELVERQSERLAKGHLPDGHDAALIEKLTSSDPEDHDIPTAVLLLVVDQAYEMTRMAYRPFMTEDEWMKHAVMFMS